MQLFQSEKITDLVKMFIIPHKRRLSEGGKGKFPIKKKKKEKSQKVGAEEKEDKKRELVAKGKPEGFPFKFHFSFF
jgi:hypothetical protein